MDWFGLGELWRHTLAQHTWMTFVPKKGSKVQNRFPRVEHVAAHLELLMCDFDRKQKKQHLRGQVLKI